MADSNIDVISQALARLGEPAITTITGSDLTDTEEKCAQLYAPTIRALLGMHDWSFASKRAALSVDGAATPINEWTYAYLLPSLQTERLGKPRAVYNSTAVHAPKFFDYEIEQKWLLTNATTIVIEYTYLVPESLWPGYFQAFVIEALAATLALPVTENASKEEWHQLKAFGTASDGGRGGLYGMARSADAMGDPTVSLLDDDDPMAAARFGGS